MSDDPEFPTEETDLPVPGVITELDYSGRVLPVWKRTQGIRTAIAIEELESERKKDE